MFTVRNSRTGRKKFQREKKGKETIILRGNPSQNEGENHGTIIETLLLI
jgi:hypothetical protein